MAAMSEYRPVELVEVDVEVGVGDDGVLGRDVLLAVADEAATSTLPEEADHDEDSTSAGLLGFDSALSTSVCMTSPGKRAEEKVVKRRVASEGHGRTCSRRSVAG